MAALDGSPHRPNALNAIRACLEARAAWIEVDIVALAQDDFLLVHDLELGGETTGSGAVEALSPEAARQLRIVHDGAPTDEAPALLSQVVALLREFGGKTRLQLDFKNVYPAPTDAIVERLVRLIAPLGPRVLVSSGADWHLRRMAALAPWLDLGFDIGFYLDYRPTPVDPRLPPYQQGAYGYHDDHLLARLPLLSTAHYLEERCDNLRRAMLEIGGSQVSTWYVSYPLVAQAMADGFSMGAFLHAHALRLDAWTVDVTKPSAMQALPVLLAAKVDQFTSNTPLALAQAVAAQLQSERA
jgi:glycerophosphoryl diester phosphodiesterase